MKDSIAGDHHTTNAFGASEPTEDRTGRRGDGEKGRPIRRVPPSPRLCIFLDRTLTPSDYHDARGHPHAWKIDVDRRNRWNHD